MLMKRRFVFRVGVKYYNKKRVAINPQAEVGKNIIFDARAGGEIKIGKSYLIGNSKFHSAGGNLVIGNEVTIGDYSFINAEGNVTIEDKVLCSDKINIIAAEHEYHDISKAVREQGNRVCKEIIIGEGSWIGVGATILSGTKIGRGCVVGAGSVVKGEFSDYCVIAGNPAKVIKFFNGVEWIKIGDK